MSILDIFRTKPAPVVQVRVPAQPAAVVHTLAIGSAHELYAAHALSGLLADGVPDRDAVKRAKAIAAEMVKP